MSFAGTVFAAIEMNRANLAKLRGRKYFSKEFNKYHAPKDVLNLEEPSAEVILLNRQEVENYKMRRRLINLIFIGVGITMLVIMILKLS